ncbi:MULTISPECIES: DUF2268 domain-containing putative Zn-dependent protease [Deinococcus]|uniref:DUF2268 domain-containing putative Zn-dependent protease n=1 Tax=Deinococcus rufus TaxID=2136097 RepID=A0ABV7Z7E0_9DEIO|nr:DUF2268 domain-containing putative Zn-dependent protease [Deinococcus sp. AB2017081]WQE95439.1 DUF2268 domain-containing putative Zn-dependent protease [Deinococcus sp. AB2017081]
MSLHNPLHLLNAGRQFPSPLANDIVTVARHALDRQAAQLGLDGVDVVMYASPWTIPETGMVGTAPDGYSVHLALTPTSTPFQEGWRQELPATLAHELHHAARWRHQGMGTLLDALVFEGLAQHFELTERRERPIYAVPTTDLDALWTRAQDELDGPYDYAAWFMGAPAAGLPRWGGYALGFELMRRGFEVQGGDAVSHVATPADAFRGVW